MVVVWCFETHKLATYYLIVNSLTPTRDNLKDLLHFYLNVAQSCWVYTEINQLTICNQWRIKTKIYWLTQTHEVLAVNCIGEVGRWMTKCVFLSLFWHKHEMWQRFIFHKFWSRETSFSFVKLFKCNRFWWNGITSTMPLVVPVPTQSGACLSPASWLWWATTLSAWPGHGMWVSQCFHSGSKFFSELIPSRLKNITFSRHQRPDLLSNVFYS